jgi:hypothetical protein
MGSQLSLDSNNKLIDVKNPNNPNLAIKIFKYLNADGFEIINIPKEINNLPKTSTPLLDKYFQKIQILYNNNIKLHPDNMAQQLLLNTDLKLTSLTSLPLNSEVLRIYQNILMAFMISTYYFINPKNNVVILPKTYLTNNYAEFIDLMSQQDLSDQKYRNVINENLKRFIEKIQKFNITESIKIANIHFFIINIIIKTIIDKILNKIDESKFSDYCNGLIKILPDINCKIENNEFLFNSDYILKLNDLINNEVLPSTIEKPLITNASNSAPVTTNTSVTPVNNEKIAKKVKNTIYLIGIIYCICICFICIAVYMLFTKK